MISFADTITEYHYNTIVAIGEQGVYIVDRRRPKPKRFRLQAEYEFFVRLIPFPEIMRIIVRREATGERIRNLILVIAAAILSCGIIAGAFYMGFILISTILLIVPVAAISYVFAMFKDPDLHMDVTAEGKKYGVIISQKKWETINADLLQIIKGAGITAEIMVRE